MKIKLSITVTASEEWINENFGEAKRDVQSGKLQRDVMGTVHNEEKPSKVIATYEVIKK